MHRNDSNKSIIICLDKQVQSDLGLHWYEDLSVPNIKGICRVLYRKYLMKP